MFLDFIKPKIIVRCYLKRKAVVLYVALMGDWR